MYTKQARVIRVIWKRYFTVKFTCNGRTDSEIILQKERKGKPFSGTQRYAAKAKKAVPADDFKTDETQPSTSRVVNQSDSDSEKPIGSSRKKMENTKQKPLHR